MKSIARTTVAAVIAILAACSGSPAQDANGRGTAAAETRAEVVAVLESGWERALARADSIDDALFQPLPLLTPAQENALRRHPNAEHLARARRLGVRPAGEAALDAYVREGTLVALEPSTPWWIVRRLDHSVAYVTPDTRALLEELGRRFQERLARHGLPPYRFEISSVLRTASHQQALRGENANATRGTSAHEFGTTVDVAYNGFAAPERNRTESDDVDRALARLEDLMLERIAGRRSHEIKAILGSVLAEMQDEGMVLVTLERLQPVFHLTVARRLATGA